MTPGIGIQFSPRVLASNPEMNNWIEKSLPLPFIIFSINCREKWDEVIRKIQIKNINL